MAAASRSRRRMYGESSYRLEQFMSGALQNSVREATWNGEEKGEYAHFADSVYNAGLVHAYYRSSSRARCENERADERNREERADMGAYRWRRGWRNMGEHKRQAEHRRARSGQIRRRDAQTGEQRGRAARACIAETRARESDVI